MNWHFITDDDENELLLASENSEIATYVFASGIYLKERISRPLNEIELQVIKNHGTDYRGASEAIFETFRYNH